MRPKIIPQRLLRRSGTVVGMLALLSSVPTAARPPESPPQKGKPSLTLRANPPIGFAPARTVVTAELVGGANDYEEFYCPKIEWSWGADDAVSSASDDCEPYQASKSQIRRRFTQEHTYQEPGRFEITFRMKQGDKIVGFVKTTVEVRGQDGLTGDGSRPLARGRF
jgi:hypothetical protein